MGRAGVRVDNLICILSLIVPISSVPARVLAQAEGGWVGKRVVPKHREFVLRLDDEPVEPSRGAIVIYRVERAEDKGLWLQAEGQRLGGSAAVEDLIPVEGAVAFFDERIRTHPQDAFAYARKALVRQDQKAFDAALRDYDQALELEPRNASLHRGRGDVHLALGEADRAISDYDKAIRLDPKSALAFSARGVAWGRKKDHDKAIEDLSEAIWLDPLCVPAYLSRAAEWQAKRENEKAVVDYNVVIRLDPENASAYCRRGVAWSGLKAYAKSVADLERAIQLGSQDPAAYERLAWIRATCPVARLRDGKKALEAAARACELTRSKDASCLSTLAAAHAEAGDFDSAVRWQAEANRLEPNAEKRGEGDARLRLYREGKPYHDETP
jgi:tetratricopeptide (TPR) repeat protein